MVRKACNYCPAYCAQQWIFMLWKKLIGDVKFHGHVQRCRFWSKKFGTSRFKFPFFLRFNGRSPWRLCKKCTYSVELPRLWRDNWLKVKWNLFMFIFTKDFLDLRNWTNTARMNYSSSFNLSYLRWTQRFYRPNCEDSTLYIINSIFF